MKSFLVITSVLIVALTTTSCNSSSNPDNISGETAQNSAERERRNLSGTWTFRDGSLYCEGFLTLENGREHCADDVPGDWEPFEFNGMTYYRQPLASL